MSLRITPAVLMFVGLGASAAPVCESSSGEPNCVLESSQDSGKKGAQAKNIFDKELEPCSLKPITGFFRTGSCETAANDYGQHTVCAVMTDEFLKYTKAQGNDLSTPNERYGFPGLKAGDSWCLCASRWHEAQKSGVAPLIKPNSTEVSALNSIPKAILIKASISKPKNDQGTSD